VSRFCIVILNVVMLSDVMLSVIMLSVLMLSVIMPSVVILNVVAPVFITTNKGKFSYQLTLQFTFYCFRQLLEILWDKSSHFSCASLRID
jgi:hypothetical protein